MKNVFLQGIGLLLGLFGAGALVSTYLPIINPGHFRAQTGSEGQPVAVYIVGTVLAVVMMTLGLLISKKAQSQAAAAQKDAKKEADWQVIVKWLLVLALLFAVLFGGVSIRG